MSVAYEIVLNFVYSPLLFTFIPGLNGKLSTLLLTMVQQMQQQQQ